MIYSLWLTIPNGSSSPPPPNSPNYKQMELLGSTGKIRIVEVLGEDLSGENVSKTCFTHRLSLSAF